MKTKIRVSLALVAVFAVVMVVGNPLRFIKGQDRNCGADIRPRNVTATITWVPRVGQDRSYVRITGHIGPTTIDEPRAGASPARFHAQACPGETALIVGTALAGPLPSIVCTLQAGGTQLTGGAIERDSVAGQRAWCRAVIK